MAPFFLERIFDTMDLYKIFAFFCFVYQLLISVLNYAVAGKRAISMRRLIDIMVGLSWTLTSIWWFITFINA